MNRSISFIKETNLLERKIKYKFSFINKNEPVVFDPLMGCNHSFTTPNNLKNIYNA